MSDRDDGDDHGVAQRLQRRAGRAASGPAPHTPITSAENSSGTTSMNSRRMKICPTGWVTLLDHPLEPGRVPEHGVGHEPGHRADGNAEEHLLVGLHTGAKPSGERRWRIPRIRGKLPAHRGIPRPAHRDALPPALFRRLSRRVGAAQGAERLRTHLPDDVLVRLRRRPRTWWRRSSSRCGRAVVKGRRDRRRGVVAQSACPPRTCEWTSTRTGTSGSRCAPGKLVHPRRSSVLFLNRVRGGALAVTREPPDPRQPLARAPDRLEDLTLVAPRPNRCVVFDGTLTHGVLDANNQSPGRASSRAIPGSGAPSR